MFLPLCAKHEHSCFEGIDAYEEEIAQDGNIIEVDFEIGLTQMNMMISTPHWEKCQRG